MHLNAIQLKTSGINQQIVHFRSISPQLFSFQRNSAPPHHPRTKRSSVLVSSSTPESDGDSDAFKASNDPTVEEAARTLQDIMNLFQDGTLEPITAYLPQRCIDACLNRRKSQIRSVLEQQQQQQQQKGTVPPTSSSSASTSSNNNRDSDLNFLQILDLSQPFDLSFDSYAYRGLILSPPQSIQFLSSLLLSPDRFVSRFHVTAHTGEEMTLLVEAAAEDELEPKYRGIRVVKRWFLKKISGETSWTDIPTCPSNDIGPESVVLAQCQALRLGNAAGVFSFASPDNAAATGPLDRFEVMLRSATPYNVLWEHSRSEILRSAQFPRYRTVVLVGIQVDSNNNSKDRGRILGGRGGLGVPNAGDTKDANIDRYVFAWSVSLQQDEKSQYYNCWMTDSVQLVG